MESKNLPTTTTEVVQECERLTTTEVVQECERLFQSGKQSKAIARLDAALLSTPDTAERHHLLTELAQELLYLVDSDRQDCVALAPEFKACLGSGLGIGQAIRGMAEGGWLLTTQPFFMEPRVREVLMALSDRASAVEIIARQVEPQLEDAKGLVEPEDVDLVLYRLGHLHRLASQPMDGTLMARTLEYAQQLFKGLTTRTEDVFMPLKTQCLELVNACLTPEALRVKYGIKSRLALQATVDPSTGQWTWTKLQHSASTPEKALREQPLFYADIATLLNAEPPMRWSLVKKAVALAEKLGWETPDRQWLLWAFPAARRGDTSQLIEQLKRIIIKDGQDKHATARDLFYLCLRDLIKAGMPWTEKIAITEKVCSTFGWWLSAKDEWLLHMLCAQGGNPQPLIQLLASDVLPDGFVDRERLEALLALCQDTAWKVSARIDLIAAIRPYLDNAPELREPFEALLTSFRWRASTRVASSAQATKAPATADELVRQTRERMSPWFTIDTRQAPLVTTRTSRDKAPATTEDKEHFEAALATWISIELLQKSMSWAQLMGCIDEIERVWKQTIDRNLLLDLCIQQVERTEAGDVKTLQDHLPKLIEAHPSRDTLLKLLAIAGRTDWSPFIRAALLPHLLAWVRPSHDIALHLACVQAILSLPAGDVRATAIDRFVAAYGGDEAISQLFGTVALQQEKPAPSLQATLHATQRPPANPQAWPGWRALYAALWEAIAERLSTALTQDQTQKDTSKLLLDALSTLATPASGDMALAIPQLFDLLGDLSRAVPQDQRITFLERLHALSLLWRGAPVQQAAVRGALQALVAQEPGNSTSRMLAPNTNQLAIDAATALFSHGFLYWMASQRKEDITAQACLHELKLRWDRSPVRTHAPDMAALIAQLFNLQNPQ